MPKEKHTNHRRSRSPNKHRKKSKERSRERDHVAKGKNRERDKKSRHHRRSSSSSSSSSTSTSSSRTSVSPPTTTSQRSVDLIKALEERRLRDVNERKRQKEDLKSKETPEEKRARRLREKLAKEQRRRQRMGWDNEYQHYSNEDNPFGDSNLTSTFRWGKKLEKEGLHNVSHKAVEVLSLQKQLENKRELEKVKKRRMERELERQARDEELLQQQRAKEAVQFREWQRQEEQFHLDQARLRSQIRIRDGRAKPIDLLAQYVSGVKLEDAIEMQMHEPYMLINGLDITDLEDLLVDIKVYVELEQSKNIDFWNDMVIIVEDELQKQQKLRREHEGNAMGRREGIHQSVIKDVADIFRGKNATQLDEMRKRIETKINERADGVDVSYWESLLSQLKAHMARARLRDRHQELLREKLQMLKQERDDAENQTEIAEHSVVKKEDREVEQQQQSENEAAANENSDDTNSQENDHQSETDSVDLTQRMMDMYAEGNYSPTYLRDSDIDDSIQVLTVKNDDTNLYRERSKVCINVVKNMAKSEHQIAAAAERHGNMTALERQMYNDARKCMQNDEAEFSVETPLEAPALMATDKYRPRKPRYFNRVHTGFEWNKYNQTHYDMDNPPPKIVQGYKFNIFYPDLMDKSLTPQYFLTPCEDNPDFAVLRFHTGPPYEDIAFKIVNREWEFSYKRGFRCQFHNNIFQLWFHFKRYRYRR